MALEREGREVRSFITEVIVGKLAKNRSVFIGLLVLGLVLGLGLVSPQQVEAGPFRAAASALVQVALLPVKVAANVRERSLDRRDARRSNRGRRGCGC